MLSSNLQLQLFNQLINLHLLELQFPHGMDMSILHNQPRVPVHSVPEAGWKMPCHGWVMWLVHPFCHPKLAWLKGKLFGNLVPRNKEKVSFLCAYNVVWRLEEKGVRRGKRR
jgi:hypothetical protein